MRHNDEGILFIDLTQRKAFISFVLNENIFFKLYSNDIKQHSTFLYTCLDKIDKNFFSLSQLKAIVVCVGYGSYTGIRISLSTVMGLIQVHDIPVIPIQSFDILLSSILLNKIMLDDFYVALYARQNHFIYAHYDRMQQKLFPTQQFIYDKEEDVEIMT